MPESVACHLGCLQTVRWVPEIRRAAADWQLDPFLLGGLVVQESAGDPYALRVERGFWRRYAAGIRAAVLGNFYVPDDRWLAFPDLASASWGLCQLMWPVAVELGFKAPSPAWLCDPTLNTSLGAKALAGHLRRYGGDVHRALLRYNGGGDAAYPRRVVEWGRHLQEQPRFAGLGVRG